MHSKYLRLIGSVCLQHTADSCSGFDGVVPRVRATSGGVQCPLVIAAAGQYALRYNEKS
jgi:hypothetical protein